MEVNDRLVSINLEKTPPKEARISVFDRGFLFGDSVYEVVRTFKGKLFTFDEHFHRLETSARFIHLKLPFNYQQLKAHLEALVEELGEENTYLRVIVTRGGTEVDIEPPNPMEPRTIVIAKKLKAWPEKNYRDGLKLAVVDIRRNSRRSLSPEIKSGNYLNNYLALHEAIGKGADDAVMLNLDDEITECANSNIFFVFDGAVKTPPMESGILAGVTRKILVENITASRPIVAEPLKISDIKHATEAFLTSTTRNIMPVRAIDDLTFEVNGPITRELTQAFDTYVDEHLPS